MSNEIERGLSQVDELLNIPDQYWLLGAGISKEAGLPLMKPLTDHIEDLVVEDDLKMFTAVRRYLPDSANVEDILSHLGDLIAIAKRSQDDECTFNGDEYTVDELRNFHADILSKIRKILRFGYKPATDGQVEVIGDKDNPIVHVQNHLNFVKALFDERRKGFNRRPPIKFFTTNYDTLLEDSLALNRLNYVDGFSGGAMAFWDPKIYNEYASKYIDAELYKLHGSIDWFVSEEDIVVRRREGVSYPDKERSRLLIYPQASKYMLTRRDPFSSLFSKFRESLYTEKSAILVVCGYSFGDEHINEEINRTMTFSGNSLTLLAFVKQDKNKLDHDNKGLPEQIYRWLSSEQTNWGNRLVVATDLGLFQGSLENKIPPEDDSTYNWWTFEGLTKLLKNGPREVI